MLGVEGRAGKIEVRLASCSPGDTRTQLGLESRTDYYSVFGVATRWLTNTTLLPLLSYSRRRVKRVGRGAGTRRTGDLLRGRRLGLKLRWTRPYGGRVPRTRYLTKPVERGAGFKDWN
jgi:hypothetical protein